MKICVPTIGKKGLDEIVSKSFEKATTYTIIDNKNNEISVIDNTSEYLDGQNNLLKIIAQTNANIVLIGGLSGKAKAMFENLAIRVFIGASGTVREAIQLLRDGKLQEVTNENAYLDNTLKMFENVYSGYSLKTNIM